MSLWTYRHHRLGLVAVEQSQATQILSELAFDTDLDQIVLEQNTVILEDESRQGKQTITASCTYCGKG